MFQRLSSSRQSSLAKNVAFLLAILITWELIWFIEIYCFKLTQISVFLPRFSFNTEYDSFHFNFQSVEKFEHVKTFQLIEINFQFVENAKFLAITLHKLLISRNLIQLIG